MEWVLHPVPHTSTSLLLLYSCWIDFTEALRRNQHIDTLAPAPVEKLSSVVAELSGSVVSSEPEMPKFSNLPPPSLSAKKLSRKGLWMRTSRSQFVFSGKAPGGGREGTLFQLWQVLREFSMNLIFLGAGKKGFFVSARQQFDSHCPRWFFEQDKLTFTSVLQAMRF